MTDIAIINAMASLVATPESIAYVRDLNIDGRLIEPNCGFVFVTLANLFSGPAGNVFRMSPEGGPVVVIGAMGHCENIRDLVAWPLYRSNHITLATLKLEAELLGVPQALRHKQTGQPLRLLRTPEDWLMSGFDGVCVTSQRHGGHWLSRLPGPFHCEDIEHGREVAALLRPYGKESLVRVPAPEPEIREAA